MKLQKYIAKIALLGLLLSLFWGLILNSINAFAEIVPRSMGSDSRIKIVNYSENNVIKITCYYDMQTTIQLGKDEKVSTISMGDTTGWQLHNVGSMIFLKPMELEADTNMTLVTNKRIYFFDLVAEEVTAKNRNNVAYNIKFLYPDENEVYQSKTVINSSIAEPDLEHPERYNFNYFVSGDNEIAPVKIFDDGKLTFLQFSYQTKDLPAILAVDEDLKEHIVNYTVSKNKNNLIIIEQVFGKLTMRLGKKVLCIYNEGYEKTPLEGE